MRRIPEATVAEIKQANEIVSVVEQYLPLQKKSSSNYFGLCPFHSENTPSFSVNPRGQFFYCFGCHKGGDVVNFIKEVEHLEYGQALRYLAERAHIELPEMDDDEYRAQKARDEALQAIMLEAARFFYNKLNSASARTAIDYLKKRKISKTNIIRFGLGFAPDSWDELFNTLKKKSFSDEILLASGLFKRSERGKIYDLFRNRLIFPIISAFGKGRVIGFGGRVLDDAKPKYINSPETDFFIKGNQLYALNLAKKSSYDFFLLVEGYLDVMAAFEAEVDCAVAPLGTALTSAQAKLMKQYKNKVIVCFDADKAGQNAALRSFAILEEAGLEVSVLLVPDGKDPDDYVREHGGAAFKALLGQAVSVFDYRLYLAKASGSPDGSLNPQLYFTALMEFLPDIKSESMREVYLGKAAHVLGVSLASLRSDVEAAIKNRKVTSTAPSYIAGTAPRQSAPGGQDPDAALKAAKPIPDKLVKSAHYKAAAALVFILSRQPELVKTLPRPLEGPLLAPLGPEAFSHDLAAALNQESLRLDQLYNFIGEYHPEPSLLISELTAMRVAEEELNSIDIHNQTQKTQYQEDARMNFQRCRSYALKYQVQLTLQQMQNPDLTAPEKAAKKLLYDLLLKEISSLNT